MAEIKNSESDMSTQQKAELDKEKRKEEKKEAKRAKRQHYRELNEPPKLTVLEEVGNAVTHGIGAGLIQHCCCELRFQSVFEGYTFDKLQIYFQLRWHPLSRLGDPIKVIKKMKQTDNFKFAELESVYFILSIISACAFLFYPYSCKQHNIFHFFLLMMPC